MLLESSLAEKTPELQYNEITKDSVFIGTVINHSYDEKRITLNSFKNYTPERLYFQPFNNSKKIYLYGNIFNPIGKDTFLFNKLKNGQIPDIVSYNKILQEFNYESTDNFLKLSQGMYPVDYVYINKYVPDFSYEKAFNLDSEICEFQQFPSIYMFLLIVNK